MRTVKSLGVAGIAAVLFTVASYADTGSGAAAGSAGATPSGDVTWPIQLALVPKFQLVHEDNSIQGVRLNIYGRNQNMAGVDLGLAHETKGDFKGVSFGLVNIVHGEGRGLQFSGLYAEATTRMAGLQVGMVNRSNNMHGLQIGLANFADDMTGIQIGLWNEIKSKEQWQIIPIINAAF
jgi:hypothetical protein